jgi:hypothetical protein
VCLWHARLFGVVGFSDWPGPSGSGAYRNPESVVGANLCKNMISRRSICSIWHKDAIPARFKSLRRRAERSAEV